MILLLGATGYLGRAFAAEMRRRKVEFIPLSRRAVDYTRFDVLFNYVVKSKPALVINSAGYPGKADEHQCEASRAEALRANTLLPQTLARVCCLAQVPWAHVSSGAIFRGGRIAENGASRIERDLSQPELQRLFDMQPEKFHGYTESDEPNHSFRAPPCTFYAGTKALAEEALKLFDRGYVWRPSILFDEFDHPRNFLSKLRGDSNAANSINSFSHRGDFVRACLDLWERRAPFGVYNIVNPGAASKHQIAAAIQRAASAASSFDGSLPSTSTILDAAKLLSTGVAMRPLQEALEDSLKKWQPTPQNEEWPGTSAGNKL